LKQFGTAEKKKNTISNAYICKEILENIVSTTCVLTIFETSRNYREKWKQCL